MENVLRVSCMTMSDGLIQFFQHPVSRCKLCTLCLTGWRSKYVLSSESTQRTFERTCPSCRAYIPPSKEQVSLLKATKSMIQKYERDGEQNTPDYKQLCGDLKKIETQIGKVCCVFILRPSLPSILLMKQMCDFF